MTSRAPPSVFGLREGYPERIDPNLATGYGTPILQSAGSKFAGGVDVSEEAIRHGRSKHGLVGIRGDALELPFRPASFEILVSLETIEHVTTRGLPGRRPISWCVLARKVG